jgi:hypothetical protein
MSDFIEQCRREWKRLGVPDPLAEEMATDLATDLSEAEAEGVSVEQLLGRIAFDPPSFAARWAAERGVIPDKLNRTTVHRRPAALVAFTATSAIALIVAAALLLTGEPKLTVNAHTGPGLAPPTGISGQVHSTSASAPIEWIFLVLAMIALAFAARLWVNWRRSETPPIAPA